MDNLTHFRMSSNNYKSPRLQNQPASESNAKRDENDPKKSVLLSPVNDAKSYQFLAKSPNKDQNMASDKSMTPKAIKILANRGQQQDSTKKTEKIKKGLPSRDLDALPALGQEEKTKAIVFIDNHKKNIPEDQYDEINGRDSDDNININIENDRQSLLRGPKLPAIITKKILPKVDSKKSFSRRIGIDRQGNILGLGKAEVEFNVAPQSVNHKVNMSNSPQIKQPKGSWKSMIRPGNENFTEGSPIYKKEDREENGDFGAGRVYAEDKAKVKIFTIPNNDQTSNLITGVKTKHISAVSKIMQTNVSGGEEEDSNTENISFSLMISPIKGSQRAAKQPKKRVETLNQRRVSSSDLREKYYDHVELKKVKNKIERQNAERKNNKKKKEEEKGYTNLSARENVAKPLYEGKEERKKDQEEDMDGWDNKNESEDSNSKYLEGEDEIEEKKQDDNSKEDEKEEVIKKGKEETSLYVDKQKIKESNGKEEKEKEKSKERSIYGTLKKIGAASPNVKENKGELAIAAAIKSNKKVQDSLQVSKQVDKDKDPAQLKREQAYKEFMMRLNFSFNIQVKTPVEKTFTAYKYFLGKGNNSIMIKAMMKQRWWWVQVDNKEAPDINFMWTQLKQNTFIETLKPTRKTPFESLEGSGVSSYNMNDTTANSTTMIDSVTDCESDNAEGETKVSAKKSRKSQSQKSSTKGRKNEISEAAKAQEDSVMAGFKKLFTSHEIMLMTSSANNKKNSKLFTEDFEEIAKMRKGPPFQMIEDPSKMKMCNHLESNFHLANKKALLWNMKSYYEAIKTNVFDHLPLTFHIRNGFDDKEYQKFIEYYSQREKEIQEQELQEAKDGKKNNKKSKNIWIVKPGENTNRGVGIHVCDCLSQINELVAATEGNTDGKKRTYLIQQYLDKPLLYNKRKFDIRCYILITCINGIMKGYWYQEGYIRTASKEFSLKNVTNKFVHLTNDAVQKKAEDYGKFEAGNKLSYNDFQKYLDAHHDGNINFYNDIYPQIRQLAIDSIKGVYGKIDPNRRENTFEVFGLDFMVDTNLKAWLIEVNTNPDINASSPALTRVIPNMVENALRLTIDQMYPPPSWLSSKKQILPENLLENNKFELVFDEVEDGPALRSILQPDKGASGDLILEIVAEEEEEDVEDENKE